jgi:DNA-binding NarL/FixJ family response regulator
LKTATFGWLALLVAAVALGGMAGTKKLTDAENSVGETARAAGGTALDPEVVAQLLVRRAGGPLDVLSPRELEVLGLMAEGRSNSAVASQLVLTVGAVEKHVANIFTKLRLPPSAEDHRRALAVLAYLQS